MDEPLEVVLDDRDRMLADLNLAVDALSAALRREREARQRALARVDAYGLRLQALGQLDEQGELREGS